MQRIIFQKQVSKGSRFNQIYIPKEFNNRIQPGDIVQIKLVKKQIHLFYSDKMIKLSNYKKDLIKKIFSFLTKKGIKQILIVGSFLYKIVGYNDIDIVIITKKKYPKLESQLINEFNQKFHLIFYNETELKKIYKSDPIQRTMLNYFVSNQLIKLPKKKEFDKKLIEYYLMLPEDLLNVVLPFNQFKKNIKRLVTMEIFLDNKKLDINKINNETEKLTKDIIIEDFDYPNKSQIKTIRKIIKNKLKIVKNRL